MLKFSFITNKDLKYYIILFAIAVGVYSNTFHHDFVLDDDVVFRQNQFVQEGFTAIPDILTHGFCMGITKKMINHTDH
ncbi:MAG: hypothetical protein JKY48_04085 [Flavobacteriales bacterium]|nr:hypothetical protein [Flavobacteriales bacterium]